MKIADSAAALAPPRGILYPGDMPSEVQPYPAALERWWLREACGGEAGEAEPENTLTGYVSVVERLSDLFTTERKTDFGSYGADRRLLVAYGLFYYPQTFTRVQFPLREAALRSGAFPKPGPVRVLDLGTGSGAALTGAVELLQSLGQRAIEAHGVDAAPHALELARRIAQDERERWPGVTWRFSQGDLAAPGAWPEGGWDLIVSSFALNEAFHGQDDAALHRWSEEALRRLNPGGLLLLVEPALRETSERIERLRDRIAVSKTARIWAPCLHAGACPLLASGEFWCHEVRDWRPPASLEYLNRKLFRTVGQVKFSFAAFGTAAPVSREAHGDEGTFRLISPVVEKKGRLIATGCAADGKRHTYEWQTRSLSRSDIKALASIERGTVLHAEKHERKGDVIRLSGETTVCNAKG